MTMARLVLTSAEGQQIVALAETNSLGRHPTNTIQVLDKVVSKEHCRVFQQGNAWILKDLDSLNGTFLNGARISGERTLADGDEIGLGSTRARFELGPAPAKLTSPQKAPAPASERKAPEAATAARAVGMATTDRGTRPFTTLALGDRSVALAALGTLDKTRVDVSPMSRSIGTQIAARNRGFRPFEQLASDPKQMAADYERLRFSHELSREICLERDLSTLLNKILTSMFRFVRADRGVIFLMNERAELTPGASLRRDGSEAKITVSSTIMDHVIRERASVLTHDAAMDFAGAKGKSMILNRISSAIVVPLLHEDDILGVLWLDSETLARFEPEDLELVTSIAAQAAMFIEINILGRKIEQEVVNRERFSRLLSPNVAEKVLSGEMVVQKGGQLVRECAVFNSDIRGFTPLSERLAPEPLVEILNEYFELMVDTVFKYEGTLDKFMGDGIMALWGAPVVHPDDVVRAVLCAIEQLQVLEEFNARQLAKNAPALAIGIGIHTGPVVAGYIGSSRALSYTVIGDTANISARLCSVAGPGQILVSEATAERLGSRFDLEELPAAQLKGKERPYRCFAVRRPRAVQPTLSSEVEAAAQARGVADTGVAKGSPV
jgi:adenylate cyclase